MKKKSIFLLAGIFGLVTLVWIACMDRTGHETDLPTSSDQQGQLNSNSPQTAVLSIAPLTLSFGNVFLKTSSTKSWTIANTGTSGNLIIGKVAKAVLSSPITTAPGVVDEFILSLGTCAPLPRTLLPGKSCIVQVKFAPVTTGPKATDFQIDSNVGSKLRRAEGTGIFCKADAGGPYSGTGVNSTSIRLNGSRSVAGAAITTWIWDFGDGSKKTCNCPIITHTYVDPCYYGCTDSFTVKLTILDSDGCKTSDTATVEAIFTGYY